MTINPWIIKTEQPCVQPSECASGYCLESDDTQLSGTTCSGLLNGLLFVDSVYRQSDSGRLETTRILYLVVPSFVWMFSISIN